MVHNVFESRVFLTALVLTVHYVFTLPQMYMNPNLGNENDLDFLCHHFFPQDFTASSRFLETGCSIACVLLTANGQYYQGSHERTHDVNEGRQCDERKVCTKGLCTEPMGTGKATITILEGSTIHQNADMRSGASVKVYVDGKYLVKTRETNDVMAPKWYFTFVTPIISFDTKIEMVFTDRLMEHEEYLSSLTTSPKQVVDMGDENKEICSEEDNRICFKLDWAYEM